jgi:uncharacterized protein (UPF0548 family)
MRSLVTPTRSPFHLFAPSKAEVTAAVVRSGVAPLSYDPVGGTVGTLPAGFDHDVQRAVIGRGAQDWARAVSSLRRWQQFDQPWIHFHDPATPIVPGAMVAFSSWQYGVWALNLCRVVDVVDADEPAAARFGFSYGTLAGHTVAGEERFELRWDKATDEVTFEIRKYSQLRHWLVRAFGPLARYTQIRFSREAIAKVRSAVEAR